MDKPAFLELQVNSSFAVPPIYSIPEQRIQRRIEVFEEWIKANRVPLEVAKDLPRSLTQLRTWSVPHLGIVSSTNEHDYIRDHVSWGAKVRRAEELMKEVGALVDAPKTPVCATERVVSLRNEKRELKHALQLAVEQWHKLAEALVKARQSSKANADIAKALKEQLDSARADLETRDGQLSELRRELHALQALPRIVNRES